MALTIPLVADRRSLMADRCYDRDMSAITLVNSITAGVASTAEFRLFQRSHQIARVGVHAGGQATVPTTQTVVDENNNSEVSTAQIWTVYAIINGVTTQTLTVTDPNATITVVAENSGAGFMIVVS
jgi:hypothetical protein